jgi:hypothetical protein
VSSFNGQPKHRPRKITGPATGIELLQSKEYGIGTSIQRSV